MADRLTIKVPDFAKSELHADDRANLIYFLEEAKKEINRSVSSEVLGIAPSDPYPGLTVYADGNNWNPGSGEGWYTYKSNGDWYFVADINVNGGWNDMLTSTVAAGRRGAAADFKWADYDGSGIFQPSFGINEDGIANFHVQHDIKRESQMYPHVHWSSDGADLNPIYWQLNYKWAPRNDIRPEAFSAVQTVTIIATPNGDDHVHVVTETDQSASIPAMEVDTIIMMQIKRITNGATDNGDTVFGHFVDLHYQREGISTPGRAPNFYVR